MFAIRSLFALCLITACASAQTTLVVDLLNRPGSQFTDLPAAIGAAGIGDTLLLRSVDPAVMRYAGSVVSQGISIIGEGSPKPFIDGFLDISGVPSGQQVFLSNLHVGPYTDGQSMVVDGSLRVLNNAGSVHMLRVDHGEVGLTGSFLLNQLRFENNRLVTMSESTFRVVDSLSALTVRGNDRIVMQRCAVVPGIGSGATVRVENTVLTLIDTTIAGADALIGSPSPALSLCSAQVVMGGPGCSVVGGMNGASQSPAVVLSGSTLCTQPSFLQADPVSTLGIVAGVTVARFPVNGMAASLSQSTLQVTTYGPPGGISILLLGAGTATASPTTAGLLDIDLSASVTTLAIANGTGVAGFQFNLPASVAAGIPLWMQALQVGQANSLSLTNPIAIVTF